MLFLHAILLPLHSTILTGLTFSAFHLMACHLSSCNMKLEKVKKMCKPPVIFQAEGAANRFSLEPYNMEMNTNLAQYSIPFHEFSGIDFYIVWKSNIMHKITVRKMAGKLYKQLCEWSPGYTGHLSLMVDSPALNQSRNAEKHFPPISSFPAVLQENRTLRETWCCKEVLWYSWKHLHVRLFYAFRKLAVEEECTVYYALVQEPLKWQRFQSTHASQSAKWGRTNPPTSL